MVTSSRLTNELGRLIDKIYRELIGRYRFFTFELHRLNCSYTIQKYRILIFEYFKQDAYADKNSEAYKTFANSIKKSIEELYRAKRSLSNDYNIMANLGKLKK